MKTQVIEVYSFEEMYCFIIIVMMIMIIVIIIIKIMRDLSLSRGTVKDSCFSISSRSALGPTQPPVQSVPGVFPWRKVAAG
jgi:hypothetical protein